MLSNRARILFLRDEFRRHSGSGLAGNGVQFFIDFRSGLAARAADLAGSGTRNNSAIHQALLLVFMIQSMGQNTRMLAALIV
jgi:hypothetical protein